MSEDSLSRDEIAELLKSMDSGDKKKAPAKPKAPMAAALANDLESKAEELLSGMKSNGPRQRILAYDFKRPERVGKEQMRALQSLHEGFARNFGASISAVLRTIVESKLISVDQLTYSEFVYSLEVPACFNLLRPNPLDGHWILDLSPSIIYPIIDRMLGGTMGGDSSLKRPLSEIELRLTSRITNTFLRDLADAWSGTIQLDIETERIESNPLLVQIVPPNEVVILISFELIMGKSRGMLNLCVPFNTIERIGSKLTNNAWTGYASSRSSDKTQQQIRKLIDKSRVEMVVNLARSTIQAIDLFELQVGDVIATEKDIHSPLEIQIAGVHKFNGKAGTFKGKKAIEIVNAVDANGDPI
ncbi:MAG: flagellar motor switch protein FliM [Planctomycetales bacterium]|nr:flagellar motor switch protein FliM [Planctomycetales bacterium]